MLALLLAQHSLFVRPGSLLMASQAIEGLHRYGLSPLLRYFDSVRSRPNICLPIAACSVFPYFLLDKARSLHVELRCFQLLRKLGQ